MSRTLDQIYIANPITSNASTDLMYFSQSPYTSGHDAGMNFANFAAQFTTPVQTQQSAFNYRAASGSNDAFIVNLNPAATSYTDGLLISMSAGTLHNLTTSPTLAVNALPAKSIETYWGNPAIGDISANGTYIFIYNAGTDTFELINPTISTANTTFVQYNSYNTATDAGVANAYVGTLTPPIGLLLNSLQVNLIIGHANTTASTLNVNGTPTAIVLSNNSALTGGELVAGQNAMFIYSGTYNKFILLNPANGASTSGSIPSITGTANEILVNGTVATPITGTAITLTTPQSLATTATFQVNTLQLNSVNGLLDNNGNKILSLSVAGTPVNNWSISNSAAGTQLSMAATGTDPNINILYAPKGTGQFIMYTAALTQPLVIYSGTGLQHATTFNMANTSATRAVTFPDADFTVAGTALSLGGTNNNLTASNGGIVWSDASKLNILSGTATANLPLLSGSTATPAWSAFALSLGGALTTAGAHTLSGAFASTFTFTNTTNVTFPTSGTLLTSAGAVTSITGTANQIIASASVGSVTLSTPQSLATTAAFQANTIQLNNNQILDSNGYIALSLNSAGSANYVGVQNAGAAASPYVRVFGSDPNINLSFQTKGTGSYIFVSQALTVPVSFYNGTSNQHLTQFVFANTAATQTATFPDASFTIAGTTIALSGTGASSFNAYGPVFGGTTSTSALQSIAAGTSGQILVSSGAGVLPAWSTSTYPTTNAINTILYASAANTMSALATANSSVLVTSAGGVPSLSTTLPSGLSATNLTLVTPTLGAATATSVAFSPTTGGIVGTTAADNAGAGKVGELLSSANATSVAQSTGTTTQIQTLSLTAGDWDVWAIYYTAVGGTTVQTLVQAQLNTSSAAIVAPTTVQLASIAGNYSTVITGQAVYLNLGISRWNVSGATTVYLNAAATYSVSTLTGNGAIYARRRR